MTSGPTPERCRMSVSYSGKSLPITGRSNDSSMDVFGSGSRRKRKLCCKGCLTDVNKEPEKYLAKLKEPTERAPTE